MACKYTYYEIMDAYPHVLKSEVPLFEILKALLYFISIIFLFILSIFHFKKMKYLLFKKPFSINGRELDQEITQYETIDEKSFLFPDKEVSRTDIYDFNHKESKKIMKNLKESFPDNEYHIISNNFHIRKRIEYIINDNTDQTFILFSFPKIATKIKNLFKRLEQ